MHAQMKDFKKPKAFQSNIHWTNGYGTIFILPAVFLNHTVALLCTVNTVLPRCRNLGVWNVMIGAIVIAMVVPERECAFGAGRIDFDLLFAHSGSELMFCFRMVLCTNAVAPFDKNWLSCAQFLLSNCQWVMLDKKSNCLAEPPAIAFVHNTIRKTKQLIAAVCTITLCYRLCFNIYI